MASSSTSAGIDLHIHSTASDGTFSPAEILREARRLGLSAIAITDHDTVAGASGVIASGIPGDLGFLTGVEITATPPLPFSCSGSFHILGYGMDIEDPGLSRLLATLRTARKDRNPKIIKRLAAIGIHISLAAVAEASGDAQLGRPHIARYLVDNGFAGSMQDAFDRFLGVSGRAYVEKYLAGADVVMDAIRDAGGVPVLAHPLLAEARHPGHEAPEALEQLLVELRRMGLGGLEAYYPGHTDQQRTRLLDLADRLDLIATGGSDFHGAMKKETRMGSGEGDLFVPHECYTRLTHALERH